MVLIVRRTFSRLTRVLSQPALRPDTLSELKGMNSFSKVESINGVSHPENVIRLPPTNLDVLIKKGVEILRLGGILGVPTDTVYGIAGDAQHKQSIEKIYAIKGRDLKKPIAICVHSVEEVYHWGKVTVPRSLLEDLLPGPVTLVFERQSVLNPELNPETNLIGIRIPDNPFIISLAKLYCGPVALTSANLSACPSTLEVDEFKHLWSKLDLVFDGGRLSSCEESEKAARAGSTVIDLSVKGSYQIIREGSALKNCLKILKDKYNFRERGSIR